MNNDSTRKNKKWTHEEIRMLNNYATKNTPTRIIALKMHRTESGVRAKANEQNFSLKPVNQAPYDRSSKK